MLNARVTRKDSQGPHLDSSRHRRSRFCPTWLLSFLLVLAFSVPAQEPKGNGQHSPQLFNNPQALEVTLRLPWQTIVTDEFFYQGGYPSRIEFIDDQGRPVSVALETERRGMSRQVICRYPPIKLRFDKDKVTGTLFQGQGTLKLVTHCDKGIVFEQYQVLEALAYSMYNLITDFSFRVRPLSVTYIDTETGKRDGPRFAFLVEDDSKVARRNGQKKLKIATLTPERMDPREASNLSLFQYMIGNTAWSLQSDPDAKECCDNLKLIGQDPEKDPIYAIPNDFDLSQFVNARYAKPRGSLDIDSATERLFQGSCIHNPALTDARQRFLDREKAIRSLITNESRLLEESKKSATDFLDGFFKILRDRRQFDENITASCRH